MKILARTLLRSFLSMLFASAILGGITQGAEGVLAAPFLMIFGWFYFPIVFGLNVIAVGCWQQLFSKKQHGRIYLALMGAVIAAGLFSLIGIKEEGSERLYTLGYIVAASVAAALTCLWISSEDPTEDKNRAFNRVRQRRLNAGTPPKG